MAISRSLSARSRCERLVSCGGDRLRPGAVESSHLRTQADGLRKLLDGQIGLAVPVVDLRQHLVSLPLRRFEPDRRFQVGDRLVPLLAFEPEEAEVDQKSVSQLVVRPLFQNSSAVS